MPAAWLGLCIANCYNLERKGAHQESCSRFEKKTATLHNTAWCRGCAHCPGAGQIKATRGQIGTAPKHGCDSLGASDSSLAHITVLHYYHYCFNGTAHGRPGVPSARQTCDDNCYAQPQEGKGVWASNNNPHTLFCMHRAGRPKAGKQRLVRYGYLSEMQRSPMAIRSGIKQSAIPAWQWI